MGLAISIHAPVKGATYSRRLTDSVLLYFNPRSREGSDSLHPSGWACRFHFNPRSREGSDGIRRPSQQEFGISIHAPVKGATRPWIAAFISSVFQSTLP